MPLHPLIEKTNKAIDWVAEEIYWKKRWRSLLILIDVVLFLAFNPLLWPFPNLLSSFPRMLSYGWYQPAFWSLVTLILIGAVIAAARHKRKPTETGDLKHSAIKGLLPFGYEDAEDFAHLQRSQDLKECLEAIGDAYWRFGVLTGFSGVGKTSFLQAGLWPELEKRNMRCVYVKFSDLDPLESVRRACRKHLPACGGAPDDADFLSLLRAATAQDSSPVVLLFDQFERFFIDHKHKSDRAAFVQALTQWFTAMESLPIKLLICIRVAFLDRLGELHKAMKYSLGPAQDFRLERFEPDQAIEVICYLAEKEGLEYDRKSIDEIARQELADTEDGLIFPIVIQILARMVQQMTLPEDRAFNRSTFKKLGGVEGILYRYLMSTIDARETQARRRTAVKVMLALADPEGDYGDALTMEAIRARVGRGVSDAELKEAVLWLQCGDVRLISPSSEIEVDKFELAHDLMRPDLRNVADKQRYDDKRFRQNAAWGLALLLIVIGWIGWNMNHDRALAKIARAFLDAGDPQYSLRLVKRIRGDDNKALALQAFAKSYTKLGVTIKDGSPLAEAIKTAEQIKNVYSKAYALRSFAEYYAGLGDKEKARSLLAEAVEAAERIGNSFVKVATLRSIAETYAGLGDKEKASALLVEAFGMVERASGDYNKIYALRSFAEYYARLGDKEKARSLLAEAIGAIEAIEAIEPGYSYTKTGALRALAESYIMLGDKEKAGSLMVKVIEIETAEQRRFSQGQQSGRN
ncbi:MAG: hypothetical protein J2P41_10925 [Blastocatellia bacterium]|nr:hypothetical protein [Blastocatellia bacterium]